MATTWNDPATVQAYTDRVGRLAARQSGEAELVEALPEHVHRVLDLGCGDGRLIALVLAARPGATAALGVDLSPPMLDLARRRFEHDPRVTIAPHDLAMPLPEAEPYDVVVSGFAIHHLTHARKQCLFAEVAASLRPGGVFVNLEVIECATPELQAEFYERIGRPAADPEDILAPIEDQLTWMREAGLTQVDCNWRWRGFAVLVGKKPT